MVENSPQGVENSARFTVEKAGFSAQEMQQTVCELRDPKAWADWKSSSKYLPSIVDNFEVLDLDNDQKLEPWMFSHGQYKRPEYGGKVSAEMAKPVAEMEDHFRRYMQNSCLGVSKESLMFVRDSNESGFTEKLVAERQKQLEYKSFSAELKRNFKLFDANHDGNISKEEATAATERTDLSMTQVVNAAYLDKRFDEISALDDDDQVDMKAIGKADKVADGDWFFMPHIYEYGRNKDNDLTGVMSGGLLGICATALIESGGAAAAGAAGAGAAGAGAVGAGAAAATATGLIVPVVVIGAGLALGAGVEYIEFKRDQYKYLRSNLSAPLNYHKTYY